jgi:hypothetical protein
LPGQEHEWAIDLHKIGLARGIVSTAQKYLDKVASARKRVNLG